MNGQAQRGVLIVNLGTPENTSVPAVRRYLREFLMDPRVLDLEYWKRWLLVHCAILPKRPRESAAAYREIWTERGSPLLFHGQDLVANVQQRLGADCPVVLGMRYAQPSIDAALDELYERGARDITVFPLFPQYSSAAWGSAVERVYRCAQRYNVVPSLRVVPPYYADPRYISTWVEHVRAPLADFQADHCIYTFHGLPERHVRASDSSGGAHCLASPDCCQQMSAQNASCYRAQSFATARLIAEGLAMPSTEYSVAFQSRLGKDPWIRPYTDELLLRLADKGCKRLAIVSPSFTADCLETIEEIGMRAKEDFCAAGGEDLLLLPSLNSEERWCETVSQMIREVAGMEDA